MYSLNVVCPSGPRVLQVRDRNTPFQMIVDRQIHTGCYFGLREASGSFFLSLFFSGKKHFFLFPVGWLSVHLEGTSVV